jgi:mannose-1-phosphate guanylyltransferase
MSFQPSHQYALIMAGGAGTRLWPLSRRENPKQFQAFVDKQTLLQHMVELAETVVPKSHIFVMAIPKFRKQILEQLPGWDEKNLLFEPAQRDTGPAITLGMLQVHAVDEEASVAVLWSDHYIQNPEGFTQMLESGFATVTHQPESVVVVGVNPTEPNTGFGYIQMGKESGIYGELPVFTVRRFTEKPDLETAKRYVRSWDYLWNVGYEIMTSKYFFKRFRQVQPDLAEAIDELAQMVAEGRHEAAGVIYEKFPKQSIEVLFTQQLDNLTVIPADLGWSDLGAWNTLHDVLKTDHPEEMVTRGDVTMIKSSGSLAFAKDRPIALVGVHNLVVVDDGDVILVMHKDHAQDIKALTQQLETLKSELL